MFNPSTVIPKIQNILETNDQNYESYINTIDNISTYEILMILDFLFEWSLGHPNLSLITQRIYTSIQQSFLQRLSPIYFIYSMFNNKFQLFKFKYCSDHFNDLIIRANNLISYCLFRPFEYEILLFPFCKNKEINDKHNSHIYECSMFFSSKKDALYEHKVKKHFKRLILNHAPLKDFKVIITYNSKQLLSQSIVELLSKINNKSDMKHRELLFIFEIIINYVVALSQTNEVDIQYIFNEIMDFPFISPFLIYAIITIIPICSQIYTLLIPKEIIENNLTEKGDGLTKETANKYIFEKFNIYDISTDNELDDFKKLVPHFLSIYFKVDKKEEFNTIHIFRFYELTQSLKAKLMGKDFQNNLCFIDLLFFKYYFDKIFHSFPISGKTLTLCKMLNNIVPYISMISSTESNFFLNRFLKVNNIEIIEIILSMIFEKWINIIANLNYYDNFVPFLFNCLNNKRTHLLAQTLMIKLLHLGMICLTSEIKKKLLSCNDIVIILAYINALENYKYHKNFKKQQSCQKFITKLINILPFEIQNQNNIQIINIKQKQTETFNPNSIEIIKSLSSFFASNKYLNNEQMPNNFYYILSMTSMKDVTLSQFTKTIIELLKNNNKNENYPNFNIKISSIYLPTAQLFLSYLIKSKKEEHVLSLLEAMENPLKQPNSSSLHWITYFLVTHYYYLTKSISGRFNEIVSQLNRADSLYLNDIKSIIRLLLENDIPLHQTTNDLIKEYKSNFKHALAFSVVSIILNFSSTQLTQGIIDILYNPRFVIKKNQKLSFVIARLFASLPPSYLYEYIQTVMKLKHNAFAFDTLKAALTYVPIDAIEKIFANSYNFIGEKECNIIIFLQTTMFNFLRLKGSCDVAMSYINGMLKSIKDTTSIETQKCLIDSINIIFLSCKLFNKRSEIILESKNLSEEIKQSLITSLEFRRLKSIIPNVKRIPI